MSRKLLVTLIGMSLSVLFAAFKWEISYLVTALGFAASYITGNVASEKVRGK